MNRKEINLIIVLATIMVLFLALYTYQGKIGALIFKNSETITDEATKNCIQKGGVSQPRTRGDGEKYKVCFFEDNRQCEELALYNGECPVGGLKVTGYITDAAVYCAIVGGRYEIDNSKTNGVENGMCTFFNGNVCNAWDLYNGKCEKGVIDKISYDNEKYSFSLDLPKTWEGRYMASETNINGISYISFDYLNNVANLFKIAIVPASKWSSQSSLKQNYLGRDNINFFAMVYSSGPVSQTEEYLDLVSDVKNIADTFKITRPYVFAETGIENGSNYSIEIIYPFIGGIESVNVNLEINDFIQNIISQFKTTVSSADAWQGKNTFKIFYDPHEINSDFISIRFETDEYTGGAHSDNISYSFNYDLKNDKVLSLSDIFDSQSDYIKIISEKSIDYLSKLNQQEAFTNEDWIKEGAGYSEGNFKTFTINKDVITFYFNPYQVAPYAAGMQEVIIPWINLKSVLNAGEASALNLKI